MISKANTQKSELTPLAELSKTIRRVSGLVIINKVCDFFIEYKKLNMF